MATWLLGLAVCHAKHRKRICDKKLHRHDFALPLLRIAIGALAPLLPQQNNVVPLADLPLAFIVIGVIALLAVLDSFRLRAEAGDEFRLKKSAPTPSEKSMATKVRS
ncbi:hypothetical protein ACQ86O_19505 [Serratia sp. L9]|uniref:hypothetical protein n=1 Tax=Serratia sp. L9 TaxID=3423946 RepID=UPI003D669593